METVERIGNRVKPARTIVGIKGFRHLPLLRHALQVELNLVSNHETKSA